MPNSPQPPIHLSLLGNIKRWKEPASNYVLDGNPDVVSIEEIETEFLAHSASGLSLMEKLEKASYHKPGSNTRGLDLDEVLSIIHQHSSPDTVPLAKVIGATCICGRAMRITGNVQQTGVQGVIDKIVTPENVSLGHTWLRRKLHEAMGDASARKDEEAASKDASGSNSAASPAPECVVHATAHRDGTSTSHGCPADCPARHLGEVAASEICDTKAIVGRVIAICDSAGGYALTAAKLRDFLTPYLATREPVSLAERNLEKIGEHYSRHSISCSSPEGHEGKCPTQQPDELPLNQRLRWKLGRALGDEVAEIVRHYLRQRERELGWQPFETVPKGPYKTNRMIINGPNVLFWHPSFSEVRIGHWVWIDDPMSKYEGGVILEGHGFFLGSSNTHLLPEEDRERGWILPTHWMPLPAPPEEQGRRG